MNSTVVSEITTDELSALVEKGDAFFLIDVRTDEEWKNGHLPHAIHLCMDEIEHQIQNHVANKEALVVLYCGSGYRSFVSGQILQELGYTKVQSLQGGIKAWAQANLPINL